MDWVPHKRETWPWSFGRVKRDIVGREYMHEWNEAGPIMKDVLMIKGTLVRIVMVSRFGDIGITPYLDDPIGYLARIGFDDIERER